MQNPKAVLVEVRAAAGGEEAKIWADDLYRMYLRYAQKNGFKTTPLDKGILKIANPKAYQLFKNEAGVHRVQRVPTTERYGRIHTSTATVAILPVVSQTEININPGDLDWQFYRASSQGGQNVQKVNTAVRVIHKPSGLVSTCEQERYQQQNREIALELLRAKLWEKENSKKQGKIDDLRRGAVGRGMRSEKIRTYNYPQNRITDHRINKKWHNLEEVLSGNLDKIVRILQEKIK
ncbi:peptide chain release factor-like protein [Patescibacteria group bacterium]